MRSRWAGLGILVALFASALALRPQIVGIGPLLPEIQDDLSLSHAVAGLLGTIPVLCMGLFAPPAPYLLGRAGTRYAIAATVGLIGAAGLARALAPGAVPVILLTIPVGIGIGLAGALMPVAVKERFPHRPAFATGMYTTGINTGSALSAATAVPIAATAGGWRTALVVFSAVTVGLAGLWLARTRGEPPHARPDARPPRLPFRSPMVWLLVGMFGLLGITYYGMNAWLPDSYVERGWTEESAGALLAALNVASIPGGLTVAWLADRRGSRRLFLVLLASIQVLALLGIILAPSAGWLWAPLFGMSNGGLFALIMTLPLDVAHDPARVGAVAALVLGAGYCVSALAPFGLGAVRDATGSFTATLWVIVGTMCLFLALAAALTRERLHRGVEVAQGALYEPGRASSR
jgi:CP family cyanate transporter-like MFS transporter